MNKWRPGSLTQAGAGQAPTSRARAAVAIAGLLAALALSAAVAGVFPRSACLADVDGDGKREFVVVTGNPLERFGRRLTIVFSSRMPWTGLRGLGPWKSACGDIDGDGLPELLVGVWKQTRLDPVFDRRLFVYTWSERGPAPKWLGSRLSRPFVDFELKDVDGNGDLELVALELERSGGFSARAYEWSGFGFQAVDYSGAQPGGGLAGRVP